MGSRQKGFTLIELMVTIAIMAIMAAIAIPNFAEWVAKRRVASVAEKVASQIRFARAEAARLNKPVYLCPVLIKTDGKADKYCNQKDYAGSGYAVWADSPEYDQEYNGGEKADKPVDERLRTIVMNKSDKQVKVRYQIRNVGFDGKDIEGKDIEGDEKDAKILAFFPDGSIKRYSVDGSGNMGVGYPVSGFTKFTFTDNEAKDKETGERRAVTLLVSGGQVSFCANGDSRPACKYDVDLTGATCNEYGGC